MDQMNSTSVVAAAAAAVVLAALAVTLDFAVAASLGDLSGSS